PSVEPFVVETGHGKRSAFLDLRQPDQRDQLHDLARMADIFIDGYRNSSL
ncbi:MAG TPA: carnitine dehydratase, partial [Acidimicrobiaceae bacterium]|nr:carnitine dehydratase [Acidimicrobiaceae bacterium]